MIDSYRIAATTKSGETHEGLMNRSKPEIANGFIGIAREDIWRLMTCSRWSTCQNKKSKMTFT